MLLSPPPFPIQRHPRQDMASDQRHAHDPAHSYPTRAHSKPCIFFSPHILFLDGGHVTVESGSSQDIAAPHERAMMAPRSLLAGYGLNWCK
jgi:hypothetical protein